MSKVPRAYGSSSLPLVRFDEVAMLRIGNRKSRRRSRLENLPQVHSRLDLMQPHRREQRQGMVLFRESVQSCEDSPIRIDRLRKTAERAETASAFRSLWPTPNSVVGNGCLQGCPKTHRRSPPSGGVSSYNIRSSISMSSTRQGRLGIGPLRPTNGRMEGHE